MLDIDRWFQSLFDLFNTTNFQLVLLVGSGILAVSLLLLAMTHWGQSRPVWKCVVLSFVAHILLMGYAYGTRLLGPVPTVAQHADVETDEVLNVSLVDNVDFEAFDAPDVQAVDNGVIAATQAPNQTTIAAPNFELPELEPLNRPEVDTEFVIETKMPETVTKPNDYQPEKQFRLAKPVSKPVPEPDIEFNDAPIDNGFEQQLAMIPKGKIVDPETIDVQRKQAVAAVPEDLEIDFGGDLARAEITPEPHLLADSSPLTVPETTIIPQVPQKLPQPESAPWSNVSVLKPIPRPRNQLRKVARTRRLGDGQPIPRLYSLRSRESRLSVAQQNGGTIKTEQAVDNALLWLATNQESNGRWDPQQHQAGREDRVFGHNRDGAGAKADSGITGLATLAFLGAGNTHLDGPYADTVDKGLKFLIGQQKNNGDLSGDAKLFAKMYCHSMALLALSEALAMTGDNRLLTAVQKGIDFSVAAQNPTDGGWRYQPGDTGDMSQFGWQVLALHSAQLGGVKVPEKTFDQMKAFLRSCSTGVDNGLASYRPNQRPSATMTAEALLCRYFLYQYVSDAALIEAKHMLARELPNQSHVNLYYWYYGTLAMFHVGGEDWNNWNDAMKETLLPMQKTAGEEAGSWEPNGMWGGYGGRVYSTATAALSLEVYYRYLPVYAEMAKKPILRLR